MAKVYPYHTNSPEYPPEYLERLPRSRRLRGRKENPAETSRERHWWQATLQSVHQTWLGKSKSSQKEAEECLWGIVEGQRRLWCVWHLETRRDDGWRKIAVTLITPIGVVRASFCRNLGTPDVPKSEALNCSKIAISVIGRVVSVNA
jgi:hypothetical protein